MSSSADISQLNTLGIQASADDLIRITEESQLPDAIDLGRQHKLPLFVLGGGSNIVIGQAHLHCLVLKIEIPGRDITEQTDNYTEVTVGAGENWDELVGWAVEHNLAGIESLSLIPGTVGAAPVQNIGAYGQELHQTLHHVRAYDVKTKEFVELLNADCHFSYRDSIFKHDGKGRYIITQVVLRLTPTDGKPKQAPTYPRLLDRLAADGITNPTLADIRKSVIAIRRSRLPDPAVIPTVGSFFGNPIVDADVALTLRSTFPDLPQWPLDDGRFKLAAAWMVEKCGLKGVVEHGVGMYDKQALALINPGRKPASDVLAFRDRVIDEVEQTFGVRLVMEPELISF